MDCIDWRKLCGNPTVSLEDFCIQFFDTVSMKTIYAIQILNFSSLLITFHGMCLVFSLFYGQVADDEKFSGYIPIGESQHEKYLCNGSFKGSDTVMFCLCWKVQDAIEYSHHYHEMV